MNVCILDTDYFRVGDIPLVPLEYDLTCYPDEEIWYYHQNLSSGWHPLLDQAVFDNSTIGFRHWLDSGKHCRRYGWGCVSKPKKAKKKKGE